MKPELDPKLLTEWIYRIVVAAERTALAVEAISRILPDIYERDRRGAGKPWASSFDAG